MKRIFFSLIVISAFFSVLNISCSKYQDGPIISFKAKKKRIANTWQHSAFVYLDQNISETNNLPTTTYTYTEDGIYFNSLGDSGKWEFKGEVDIKITITNGSADSVAIYEILRLSTKSLWLKTGQIEEHYKQAK